ncbi:hypothetical protein [Chelatococcus sp. YT9]|uniref:hypothetical protein n=1 Tax=Chelatococcus sp. YT9 TaxID=2835635 RepID=UPI001BCB2D83|nr:hypothetical protein [Chelatococcus sp. YT9]MBS7698598.1 hypothetical protein [Chelatococcus sp. YT9]
MISSPLMTDDEMVAAFNAWLASQVFEGTEEEQAASRDALIAKHEAEMQARREARAAAQRDYDRRNGLR